MKSSYFYFPAILLIIIIFLFVIFRQVPLFKINSNQTAVIKEIQQLNKLETAQYSIEKIIDAQTNTSNVFQDILYGDKILLIADGEVGAGFDLSKMQSKDVSIKGNSLQLTLPPPEIMYSKINNDKTKVYDRRMGLLTKGNKDLESEARKSAEDSIRKAACDGNILEQASVNAKKQMTTMFSGYGFSNIVIDIPRGNCQ